MKTFFRTLVLLLALLFLAAPAVFAAQSLSTGVVAATGNTMTLAINWTADTDGSFSETDITDASVYRGWYISHITTVPDGTVAPTANYDIVIGTATGLSDVTGGALADRSATDAERVALVDYVSSFVPVSSRLTLTITGNSVSGAKGVIYLHMIAGGAR